MPITQRGSSYQVAIQRKSGRIRKQFADSDTAHQFEAEVLRLLAEGRALSDINPETVLQPTEEVFYSENTTGEQLLRKAYWKLGETADRVFAERYKGSKSEETHRINLNCIKDRFGEMYLDQITSDEIEIWVDELKETLSGGTINRKLSSLRVVLEYAVKKNRLDKLPYMPRQKEATVRPRYLTQQQVNQLIETAEFIADKDVRDAIIIAVNTGIRQGNLLGLKKSNVDLKNKVLRFGSDEVKNKAGDASRGYTVPLNSKSLEVIQRRLKYADGELFPMTKSSLEHRWKRLREITGVNARWHDLRHTFGSWLVQKGIDVATVSRLMNHKNISITMRYAYLAPNNYHDTVAVLE